MAAQEGKVDVVRLLTEAKADVNIQTEVLYTYIHVHYVVDSVDREEYTWICISCSYLTWVAVQQ